METLLSPWLATYTFPPLGNCAIGPGLTPTQTVVVATREVVLMTLSEPVFGQGDVAPELTTYISVEAVAARLTGRDPGYKEMLETTSCPINGNSLTESPSRLATKIAPCTAPW